MSTPPIVFDFVARTVTAPQAPVPVTQPEPARPGEAPPKRRRQLRVDWAILCRHVEVNDGLATIVGGGIDVLRLPAFPGLVGITLAVRIVGLPFADSHALQVSVLDPQMQPVIEPLKTMFDQGPANPDHPAGWEVGSILPITVKFEAPAPGPYTLDIAVDGSSHTLSFRVI